MAKIKDIPAHDIWPGDMVEESLMVQSVEFSFNRWVWLELISPKPVPVDEINGQTIWGPGPMLEQRRYEWDTVVRICSPGD
jgi:hypothetical protein